LLVPASAAPPSTPPSAPPARPPSLSGSASYLAGQVAKAALRLLAERLAEHGVRAQHLAVLTALADHGPACQQALCDALDLDKSHMVGIVDELEDLGHVARTRDPEDRRRHRVAITAGGRTLLTTLLAVHRDCQDELLAALHADERAVLVDLLGRVVVDLDRRRLGEAAPMGASAVVGSAGGRGR
jgi:DNA-binding MarR family transcriptional regulator